MTVTEARRIIAQTDSPKLKADMERFIRKEQKKERRELNLPPRRGEKQ